MLIWILMILDFASFINLSLLQFGLNYSRELLLFSGIYLIGKAIGFRDVMSIIDGIWGFYLIICFLFAVHSFFYWLILVWVIYKIVPLILDRN